MSANQSSPQKPYSVAARLERKLEKIKAAERKKFLNENIVRLEKNGDLSCEAVRTSQVPVGQASGLPTPGSGVISGDPSSITNDFNLELTPDPFASPRNAPADPAHDPAPGTDSARRPSEPVGRVVPAASAGHQPKPEAQATGAAAKQRSPAAPTRSTGQLDPNFYTETPDSPKNGQQFDAQRVAVSREANHGDAAQLVASELVTAASISDNQSPSALSQTGISIHEADTSGQKIPPDNDETADPLEELLARALARPKRGRPAAFDEHNKGKLVALLSLGMSLRQAAAVLGVSHGTIRNTLKADPALAEEITAARFQAQLQPLACVIREARRSWKAATWLLKYLDAKIASHEETPDERRQRQQRETEEFLTQAHGPGVRTRRVLG